MRRRTVLAGAFVAAACASFPDLGERAVFPAPRRGVVVTEELVASQVGQRILERGGNAVDAAVAAAFTLAVTFPEAGNIGGGGFAIYVPHDPMAESLAIDFRETAPAALTSEAFLDAEGNLDTTLAQRSALGVGVPGSVAGLHMLHSAAGRLSWRDVVEPAIRHARVGVVGANLQWKLKQAGMQARIEAGGGGAMYYPGGEIPAQSAPLHQTALAETLNRIAEFGPPGFYAGPTAEAMVNELAARDGVMTLEDVAAYAPVKRTPLRGWFRGKEIITMPPPSSGGIVVLQALAILDAFPLDQERERTLAASDKTEGPGISGRAVHWWIEALRRAFADRAEHMGDPDFYPVPTDELLSPDWVATRRISIGEQADTDTEPMPTAPESTDTTHLVVIDGEGNAVSLTTTLNSNFGTGIYVPEAGFFLNNELDDFALQAGTPNQYGLIGSQANALRPGKRPLSSMTPTVVRDGGERGDDAPRRPRRAAHHHVGLPHDSSDRGLWRDAGRGPARPPTTPAMEPGGHTLRARLGSAHPAGPAQPRPRGRGDDCGHRRSAGDSPTDRRRADGGRRSTRSTRRRCARASRPLDVALGSHAGGRALGDGAAPGGAQRRLGRAEG